MPTIPLYTPNPVADASHRVTAPGGYEWWYFDAEDLATDTQLIAIFYEGFVFHPGYRRAYARYRRRPTRVPPPMPSDYVCTHFAVYRGGRLAHHFLTQYPATDFHAARDRLDIRVGPNHCRAGADGTLHVTLRGTPRVRTGGGPKTLRQQVLSADLAFVPTFPHPPTERRLFAREMSGADHHWVVANPLCDVTGTVRLDGGAEPLSLNFRGRGYHDHNYGTAPIGPGLRRWLRGRVLTGGRAAAFHVALPSDARLPSELHLVEADEHGVREVFRERCPGVRWGRRTHSKPAYPADLALGGGLTLLAPRVIASSPFHLRLCYETKYMGEAGRAFCDVVDPRPLCWPVLGRIFQASIRRAVDGAGGPQSF